MTAIDVGRSKNRRPDPKRYALTREEAADSIGMSVDTFELRVQPSLKLIQCGRLLLVPPAELERWVAENARHPFD
jgi:hypothetical protein